MNQEGLDLKMSLKQSRNFVTCKKSVCCLSSYCNEMNGLLTICLSHSTEQKTKNHGENCCAQRQRSYETVGGDGNYWSNG